MDGVQAGGDAGSPAGWAEALRRGRCAYRVPPPPGLRASWPGRADRVWTSRPGRPSPGLMREQAKPGRTILCHPASREADAHRHDRVVIVPRRPGAGRRYRRDQGDGQGPPGSPFELGLGRSAEPALRAARLDRDQISGRTVRIQSTTTPDDHSTQSTGARLYRGSKVAAGTVLLSQALLTAGWELTATSARWGWNRGFCWRRGSPCFAVLTMRGALLPLGGLVDGVPAPGYDTANTTWSRWPPMGRAPTAQADGAAAEGGSLSQERSGWTPPVAAHQLPDSAFAGNKDRR